MRPPEENSTGARAGVGGVAAGGAEPQRVAGVADEHPSDDRADPEDLAQRRSRGGHGTGDPRPCVAQHDVEVIDLSDELDGQPMPFDGDRSSGLDALEE